MVVLRTETALGVLRVRSPPLLANRRAQKGAIINVKGATYQRRAMYVHINLYIKNRASIQIRAR